MCILTWKCLPGKNFITYEVNFPLIADVGAAFGLHLLTLLCSKEIHAQNGTICFCLVGALVGCLLCSGLS